jgi:Na+/melibiose symporter-like transporter
MLLQGIYAMYFGLSLTTIATILLLSRLFDAVADPLVGYLSDRTGHRKAFVVCGGILMIISGYFLLVPVNLDTLDASTKVSELYFLLSFLAFYLGYTLFDIPHMAWGSELTTSANETNSIFAWRAVAINCGVILFYCIPFLPIFESRDITPHTLQWAAVINGFLMLSLLFISMKLVPSKTGKEMHVKQREDNKFNLSIIISNKPLLIFLSAHLLGGLAFGIFGAMFFIFVDNYLGLGASFASVMIFSLCAGLVSIKIWHLIATRISKQLTWISGMVLISIGIFSLGVLQPNNASFPYLVAAYLVTTVGAAAINIVAPSVLSDIIDYSQWRFNANFSGSFFSLYTLVIKANLALGVALGFFVAGWYGYDPSAAIHSPESIFGLRIAVAWLPASLALLSVVFIALIPINTRRHSVICRRLNAIKSRAPLSEGISKLSSTQQNSIV